MANTITTEQLNLFYTSRKNIISILETRGYVVEDYIGSSIHEVEIMANTDQLDILVKSYKSDKQVYVKYNTKKSIRPQAINEYVNGMFGGDEPILAKTDDMIIIDAIDPNDTTKKTLNEIWDKDGLYISVVSIRSLMFNILLHRLVPEHRVLTDEEKKKIDQQYNIISDKMYPDISRFSPVPAVIGLRPGELCEIIRPSRTAISSSYYRICSQ
jgi:DNA-directed RNA polymerase subunit H (RpoH/RPB5)